MIIKVDGEVAILHSRPTPKVMAVLQQMEGRRTWINNGSALKFSASKHNIDTLKSIGDVEVEFVKDNVIPEFEQFVNRKKYVMKTVPMDHQAKALEKMSKKKVFGLFFDQGTGKTKTWLDRAGQLYCDGEITGVIVCTKKGVHRQWILSQAPEHLGCQWSGVVWPFEEEHFPNKGLQIASFNYDGMASKRGLKIALAFARRHKGKLLIIADESQDIKNMGSVRFKAIDDLAQYSSHRGLATGTPIAKDLVDEFSQLYWLDPNIVGTKYITTFKSKYCILGGFAGRAITGYKNIDEFKAVTEPYTARVTKEEIGMIPKQYDQWVIDLLPEQKKAIKEIKEDLEVNLVSGKIDVKTAVVALSKIQQISCGFIIDEEKKVHNIIHPDKNPRLEGMQDWVDADESKAIVWFRFRHDSVLIAERLRKAGISFVEYHGGISENDRTAAVDSFLSVDGAKVLIANPQSAGTGLNLQGLCTRAMYYSNSFRSIDRFQSEDRIHRIGTIGIVTITDMVARGSIDRHILNNLMKKKGVSQMVLGDILEFVRNA